ncbi:MAG: biopolymer transporter ExbD [Deltaproteobacteria bacterium]|nr:biopolymer transporter ExbD [Deltaproteobacteria bacterium]
MNVTPLVDVVLVLLIIFMLVIPNMQEGVPIELFKAKNAIKDSEEGEPIVVTVALQGSAEQASYHVGDVEMTRDALIAELVRLHQEDGNRLLLFRGDTRLPYGKIRDVFREAQNIGFAYIQLSVGAQKEGWQE